LSRIELDSVTKRFADGTTAVSSLDLEVGDGELLVLVGPSGCGKTTALRMVAGLEEVTSGTISIDGRPINDLEPRHRDIAMVFQSYALYPHLSVYDNIAFSLKYRKIAKSEIRARVSEAARILELEPYLERKPRQLSGGQRQRVAMGRAIVRQPRAFLMDEPLSNLDAKLRVQMRAEIGQLQRSLGVTTIYVTHDQTEAMTLGTKVAVISGGVLQQIAPPQLLYRRPANLFVAGFIGSPPMNLIDARVERADGGPGRVTPAARSADTGPRAALPGPTPAVRSADASPRAALPDVVFGGQRLRIPASVVSEHPGLEHYLGKQIVLGIRPEDVSDASLSSAGSADGDGRSVISLPIRLREELGSEVQVHAAIGTSAHAGADAADEVRSLSTLIAKMDPRTSIAVGDTAEIAVNCSHLHFFDPESGLSIRG
jgi:multiple sugar transport system ATP-binding protein